MITASTTMTMEILAVEMMRGEYDVHEDRWNHFAVSCHRCVTAPGDAARIRTRRAA